MECDLINYDGYDRTGWRMSRFNERTNDIKPSPYPPGSESNGTPNSRGAGVKIYLQCG